MNDLFNVLSGNPVDLRQSVQNHLKLLLNTRRGSLKHLPDYGLPEFSIKAGFQDEKMSYIHALKTVIHRFEPRISSLRIEEISVGQIDCILGIKLMVQLFDQNRSLIHALVLSSGNVILSGEGDD